MAAVGSLAMTRFCQYRADKQCECHYFDKLVVNSLKCFSQFTHIDILLILEMKSETKKNLRQTRGKSDDRQTTDTLCFLSRSFIVVNTVTNIPAVVQKWSSECDVTGGKLAKR